MGWIFGLALMDVGFGEIMEANCGIGIHGYLFFFS